VPLGSGLSSSAALEVSVASALLAAAGQTLELAEIAKLCQRAENELSARVSASWISSPRVLERRQAILLDCRSLEYKCFPCHPAVAMVICNTMVKHEHCRRRI